VVEQVPGQPPDPPRLGGDQRANRASSAEAMLIITAEARIRTPKSSPGCAGTPQPVFFLFVFGDDYQAGKTDRD
jgi:hypothetical protein